MVYHYTVGVTLLTHVAQIVKLGQILGIPLSTYLGHLKRLVCSSYSQNTWENCSCPLK